MRLVFFFAILLIGGIIVTYNTWIAGYIALLFGTLTIFAVLKANRNAKRVSAQHPEIVSNRRRISPFDTFFWVSRDSKGKKYCSTCGNWFKDVETYRMHHYNNPSCGDY